MRDKIRKEGGKNPNERDKRNIFKRDRIKKGYIKKEKGTGKKQKIRNVIGMEEKKNIYEGEKEKIQKIRNRIRKEGMKNKKKT